MNIKNTFSENLNDICELIESGERLKIDKALKFLKEHVQYHQSVEERYLYFIKAQLENPHATIFDMKADMFSDDTQHICLNYQPLIDGNSIHYEYVTEKETKRVIDFIGAMVHSVLKADEYAQEYDSAKIHAKDNSLPTQITKSWIKQLQKDILKLTKIYPEGWWSRAYKILANSKIDFIKVDKSHFYDTKRMPYLQEYMFYLLSRQTKMKIEVFDSEMHDLTDMFWRFPNPPEMTWFHSPLNYPSYPYKTKTNVRYKFDHNPQETLDLSSLQKEIIPFSNQYTSVDRIPIKMTKISRKAYIRGASIHGDKILVSIRTIVRSNKQDTLMLVDKDGKILDTYHDPKIGFSPSGLGYLFSGGNLTESAFFLFGIEDDKIVQKEEFTFSYENEFSYAWTDNLSVAFVYKEEGIELVSYHDNFVPLTMLPQKLCDKYKTKWVDVVPDYKRVCFVSTKLKEMVFYNFKTKKEEKRLPVPFKSENDGACFFLKNNHNYFLNTEEDYDYTKCHRIYDVEQGKIIFSVTDAVTTTTNYECTEIAFLFSDHSKKTLTLKVFDTTNFKQIGEQSIKVKEVRNDYFLAYSQGKIIIENHNELIMVSSNKK